MSRELRWQFAVWKAQGTLPHVAPVVGSDGDGGPQKDQRVI